jgi:PAS domain S-box-containing protein
MDSAARVRMALELSGELAKNLLELAPDATVVVDARGRIVFANAQIERTFGYAPRQLEGQPVEMLLPEALRSRHVTHRALFAERPKPRRMGDGSTLFGKHKDGHEFPLEISLSPVQSEGGMLVVAAVRDATSRHVAERELVEANRAKSRLLAGASHDLRQPVQTLTLLNQAALRHVGPNTKLTSILNQQQVALGTISALLASVLDVSKLDSGAVQPAIADCAINDVFERLQSNFWPLADDKGIALRVEPTDEGGRTDPELLRRMLGNLVSNAIRYTDKGSVRVACEREGDSLLLTVRDTGVGIPSDNLAKVFDEFYQVDRGPRRPEGLGLGLSIVRRIAALLGHKIALESVVNEGTTFTIRLPRVELPATATQRATEAAARHKGSILIVDDEAPVAHATSLLLELEGFAVRVANSKSEALEHTLAAAPDLIVSDYHLRGDETGAEVVDAVRARVGAPVPVIFVTGDTSKLARAGTQISNATLLSKPTQVDDLLAAIHHHIGGNVKHP